MTSASQARPAAGSLLLRAARAVDSVSDVDDVWLLIEGDTIRSVGTGRAAPDADQVVDLGDATLVPGFIDLHGHGGARGSYDDGPDDISAALAMHRRHGTTRSVLSLVANPLSALQHSLATIRSVMASDPLVLGAHLEGPFLSADNNGAHEPQHLLAPDRRAVETLLDAGHGVLRQITVAPELPGALEAIGTLEANGVVAAVGHTVATYDQTRLAFDAGATMLTHAFNAMPGIHHRRPGPIMAAIADGRVCLELILDGVHVEPVVASALMSLAPGRVALITDAMAAAGADDGSYALGSQNVEVSNGVAHLAGTTVIAGSTLTQDAALRNAVSWAGISLQDAVAALTSVPAHALGLHGRFGKLSPGFAADVVALSRDLTVTHVWGAGALLLDR